MIDVCYEHDKTNESRQSNPFRQGNHGKACNPTMLPYPMLPYHATLPCYPTLLPYFATPPLLPYHVATLSCYPTLPYPTLLPYHATLPCYPTLPYHATLPCYPILPCYPTLLPYFATLPCYPTMLLPYLATLPYPILPCYPTLLQYDPSSVSMSPSWEHEFVSAGCLSNDWKTVGDVYWAICRMELTGKLVWAGFGFIWATVFASSWNWNGAERMVAEYFSPASSLFTLSSLELESFEEEDRMLRFRACSSPSEESSDM